MWGEPKRIWWTTPDIIRFFSNGTNSYLHVLRSDLATLQSDEDLKSLLGEEESALPGSLTREIRRMEAVLDWCEKRASVNFDFVPMSLDDLGILKAIGLLQVANLRQRRNRVAARPAVSRHAIQEIDRRLEHIEEFLSGPLFADLEPQPLLVGADAFSEAPPPFPEHDVATRPSPRPIPQFVSSIELLDLELRSRCLDLFESFKTSAQEERYDTVITEATRVLEARIRVTSRAPDSMHGPDLIRHALVGKPPRLQVGATDQEQDAVCSLLRGVFGFIRNPVHHKLLGNMQAARVLQTLGLIDYCLGLISGAVLTSHDPADQPS